MSRTFFAGLGLAVVISSGLAGPGAAVSTTENGKSPSSQPAARCMTSHDRPCRTAKQYKRAFKRGDLGHTPYSKSEFTKAFKTKLRKAATKKGLIPPRHDTATAERRAYRYDSWGDYWDALNNVMDCVAPGAESSCQKDFHKIKALKEPTRVVLGCGGLAVATYYSGGTASVVLGGSFLCSWNLALAAW